MAKSNSRLAARICILCVVAFFLLIFLGRAVFENQAVTYSAVLFFIVAMVIKYYVLRCQNCGVRGGVPQWYKNKTIHCTKCGTAYEYDL